MSALPAERGDPLDPQQILKQLPEDERGSFLSEYRQAVDAARDPAGWQPLLRVLRLWSHHAEATKDPSYWAALETARDPVRGGMLLEDAVRRYRPGS